MSYDFLIHDKKYTEQSAKECIERIKNMFNYRGDYLHIEEIEEAVEVYKIMIKEIDMYPIIEKCKDMLGGRKLLYLVEYGSHLYGTNTENSDKDYRGVYLPTLDEVLTNSITHNIKYATNEITKNTKEDVDIDLFSFHKFINMVSNVDTNGLDLYFGYTNKERVIYLDDTFSEVFHHPDMLINIDKTESFTSYAIQQVKKYGIKGTRINIYQTILELLSTDEVGTLKDYAKQIVEECKSSTLCYLDNIGGLDYLIINNSKHLLSTKMNEFYNRIHNAYSKYGKRSIQASNNENIDWKAVSHAVRALLQVQELYKTGVYKFPLKDAVLLKEIKSGGKPFEKLKKELAEILDETLVLQKSTKYNYKFDIDFYAYMVSRLYGIEEWKKC